MEDYKPMPQIPQEVIDQLIAEQMNIEALSSPAPDIPTPAQVHELTVEDGVVEEIVYPQSPEAIAAAEAATKEIQGRSFSGRHPELGKMINCQVCGERHRKEERKCVQKFKELWIDEDLETGELTKVVATVPLHNQSPRNPLKTIFGAAQYKGKRKRHRPTVKERRLVEMTRTLYPAFEGIASEEQKQMEMARKLARVVLKQLYRIKANRRNAQQQLSRKINRGTALPGTQLDDR